MPKRGMARWVGGQQRWEEERGKNHRISSKPLRNSFVTPSKPLRNITGTTRVQHARSTLAAGWALAERAGAEREGIRRVNGIEKLGPAGGGGGIRWVVRGRQEGGSEGKGSGQRV
jgi:hypothetical protein